MSQPTDGPSDADDHLIQVLTDAARLATLARTGLMDSAPEPSFDRLARLVAQFLSTPVALISLVAADRQFFKSCVGLPQPWATRRETPHSHSFCQHVVAAGQPLVISDARLDPRVQANQAITDLGIVAYLGIPLRVDWQVIGSFYAIHQQPRTWAADDIQVMIDLAASVVAEIHLRADRDELDRQRRAAEEAWRITQLTLASIGAAVIATDVGGSIAFLNSVAEDLCGASTAEAVGQPLGAVLRLVAESTRAPIEDPSRTAIQTGQIVRLPDQTVLIAPDGRETPIETTAAPISGLGGKIEGVILVFREVTAKKHSETKLSYACLRPDNARSAGSVATFSWDLRTDLVAGDVNMARIYAIPPAEVEASPVGNYLAAIHPADRDPISQALRRAINHDEPFNSEYRVAIPGQPIWWVESRGAIIRDEQGRPRSMSGVAAEITERKQNEQRLRQSEERYSRQFETMDEGFRVIEILRDEHGDSVDYCFLEVNPAFEKHTGLAAAGRRIKELAPDLEAHWFQIYGEVGRTGKSVQFENAATALQNRRFDVHAFRCDDPALEHVAVLFNDVTERRDAEEERERLLGELREADRRKAEFLAMLAHELRNPLAAISSGVLLVETTRQPELLDQIKDMIDRQTKHLSHLIDDLLDVSRIPTGKVILRTETVELDQILARAIDQVRPMIQEKRHELRLERPDGPVRFAADPTRAEQVLANLLTNAAKYTPANGRIELVARVRGSEIVGAITDTGVGIAAAMLPPVFGLFTQHDSSLERSQGALGIGLTLVRSLVEIHGGQVLAASPGEGQGSTFTVTFPIGTPGPTAEASRTPEAIQPNPADCRILIVDDNRDTARMTGRLLAHGGFQVTTAYDGHEGVEAARQFRPHVLLLDIGLPGMNGYEVAALLRNGPACLDTVIIAVSGYGESKAQERSRQAGFHHHLTKPLDFDRLDQILGVVAAREPVAG